MTMHCPPVRLEDLPVELQQCILTFICDVGTLKTTVLSCPALFTAFKSNETAIIREVLRNQLDIDVLPEALARLEASRLSSPLSAHIVTGFIEAHQTQRCVPSSASSFADAIAIAHFHNSVNYFAIRYANYALAKRKRSGGTHPRPSEIARITRALYRFQTYNHIFSLIKGRQHVAIDLGFYAHHSPWENAQLACILDFFIQEFTPGDVMHRNPLTPHIRPENILDLYYDIIMTCPFTEHVLSFSLEQLAQLGEAPTEDARFQLVRAAGVDPEQYSHMFLDFQHMRQTGGSEFTAEGTRIVNAPFYEDADAGPEDVWRWAHHSAWDMRYHLKLRKWGYVFWDRSRLEEWGVLGPRGGT